jgi:poly-gamma-glutamate synthesis protein (capsule biosynthesis protein)
LIAVSFNRLISFTLSSFKPSRPIQPGLLQPDTAGGRDITAILRSGRGHAPWNTAGTHTMKRRQFINHCAFASLAAAFPSGVLAMSSPTTRAQPRTGNTVTLFLAGDVMTGRGIDQVLAHPGDPRIFEPWSRSALDYVQLAEQVNGPIPRPVDTAWIWGDALPVLAQAAPDVRIINLETAVTAHGIPWPGKGIQYRMHPANIACLTAAAIDCCILANNHVLDWNRAGLEETLDSLTHAGLASAGAGRNAAEAAAPAAFPLPERGRVLVFAWGLPSSGIPGTWAATGHTPGISLLPDLSDASSELVSATVAGHRRPGDRVVISLHWGGNWGYPVPESHRRFARALIDAESADLIHGHSSHHPLGMELYRDRLILYGCGDLIDDYEGIGGHEPFRIDLALLYLVTLEAGTGRLQGLELVPMQRRRFRLNRASRADGDWLRTTLARESMLPGAGLELTDHTTLRLVRT